MIACTRCGTDVLEPDLATAIDMEKTFRDAFPVTWEQEAGRTVVCQDCYDELEELEPKSNWEQSQLD